MARTTGSHSDITGPKIRDAAVRLFARHGYAAVSMRQIAAEVGVQVGALYNYTSDKQSLLFSLLEAHMLEVLQARAGQLPVAGPVARLDDFVRFHILHHLERPDAVFISYMELRSLEPANFARIETLRRDYEDELETILRDGAAQGCFGVPDPKLATLAVIAMLNGVLTWYRETGRLSREEVADAYCEMARKLVAA